jgi:hypothetical protein
VYYIFSIFLNIFSKVGTTFVLPSALTTCRYLKQL